MPDTPPAPPIDRLRAIMFTDIEGSIALSTRLGERAYRHLQAHHHRLFYHVLERFEGVDLVQSLGDGFYTTFRTSADAVRAALIFQHALRSDDRFVVPCPVGEPDEPRQGGTDRLGVRIGIHLGAMPDKIDPESVARISTSVAHRIMMLGRGGQILVSRSVYDTAAPTLQSHPSFEEQATPAAVRWQKHGRYRFHGQSDEFEIIEVGAPGAAPFVKPDDCEKGWAVPEGFPRFLRWMKLNGEDVTAELRFESDRVRDFIEHPQLTDHMLIVLSGRDAGASFQLSGKPPYVVGRETATSKPDISVNDRYISRRHFLIDWSQEQHTLLLEPLVEGGPVSVNGNLLSASSGATGRLALGDGDRIAIASTEMLVVKLPRSLELNEMLKRIAERALTDSAPRADNLRA